jgi:nucleoside-diphosphate-sugar epimerase
MKVFITGGSGFIGSRIIPELLSRGHTVVALARSDASAEKILAHDSSIEIVKGDLTDIEILRYTASRPDIEGIIHTGFIHDFANIAASGKIDLAVIQAFGAGLKGTDKPLVSTSGNLIGSDGQLLTEKDNYDPRSLALYRKPSEDAVYALAKEGVRSSVVRLAPTVHGNNDWGFIPFAISLAKKNGVSPFVLRKDDTGKSVRWNAVHVEDAARLYVLALESAPAGSTLHGAGEQEVEWEKIAQIIGDKLHVPVKSLKADEAGDHFEWLTKFVSLDAPVSSQMTRELLGWEPKGVTLLEDLKTGDYFGKYE